MTAEHPSAQEPHPEPPHAEGSRAEHPEPGSPVAGLRRRAGHLRTTSVRTLGRTLSRSRSLARTGTELMRERLTERRLADRLSPRGSDAFTAVVYFAGDTSGLYQLHDWLWSLERLAERLRTAGHSTEPVGIVCRSAAHAEALAARTPLPVRAARLSSRLDAVMTQPSLRLALYVNQATTNFLALRYRQPAHVHLSHGESEKTSMVSNQLKAYDFILTAGPAARARILTALPGYREQGGEARMVDVGRPQLDRPRPAPQAWTEAATDARLTVFYAPTWEGDSPAMAYGSLHAVGHRLVTGLLDAGARIIIRPHPRTGHTDIAEARALAELRALAAAHPRAYLDEDARIGWQFDAAEVCVADMSALAFDWLATDKPLVLIRPPGPAAEVVPGGLFDRVPSADPHDPAALIRTVLAAGITPAVPEAPAGEAETRAAAVPEAPAGEAGAGAAAAAGAFPPLAATRAHYLGETRPGAQQARFEEAALGIIAAREALLTPR